MAEPTRTYTATLTTTGARRGWSAIFRHPVLTERGTGEAGRRVHRGLGTRDKAEAETLVGQLNELLADRSYWSPAAQAHATRRFDPRVVSIFFDELLPEGPGSTHLREEIIPLPTSARNDYRQVLLLGTTGAGKTTVVRQLIGTDPDKDRFPSTSTAKTTVADTEIVLASGGYRVVVTFLPADEVRDHLEECISRAVLAAYRQDSDSEILRYLLNHVDQRLRFSYVLGTGHAVELDESDEEIPEEGLEEPEDFAPEGSEHIDLEATRQLLEATVATLKEIARRHGHGLKAQLRATDSDQRVIDELFEEELDRLLRDDEDFHRVADRLMDEIEARFALLTKGTARRNRQGWPESWHWETHDRVAFLREVRRFSSNDARLFGLLLTPLVNGIRVTGPFAPTWLAGDTPKLVLLDTEGLGHTVESSSSVSTAVVRRFEGVDAVLLVDNAAQPMQAAPSAAMRAMVATGQASKLLVCFTHFDTVKGANLPNPRAREQHVLASAENVLAAIGEDLGPYAERILRRRLQDGCIFVGHIDEALGPSEKRDKRTVEQLLALLKAIDTIVDRPKPGPARPQYDRLNLVLAVKAAAEAFHDSWLPRLGLKVKPGVSKEHWARIKALNRRLAEGWRDEYDTLRPVADLHHQLQKRIYVAIQSPVRWNGTEPQEDEKQQLFDNFADRTSHHLIDLATRRVWQQRHPEWQKAYRLHGTGSTFQRAEVIAREVYDRAAPVPDVTPSPDRNEFLHEVVQAVETAAKELEIDLR